MLKRWNLDPGEVVAGSESAASGGGKQKSQSGGVDLRDYRVWLEHRPTGIRAEGQVPDGHYTREEVKILEAELRKSLFAELELKVARHLGVSGV